MKFTITMKPIKAVLVLLLSLLFLYVFPQKKQINFEYLQTRGLSQNSINCMLKDHYGLMWFGTQVGLNKFDGYKFTVYTHTINDPKSIAANNIAGLCEDKEGDLWVATKLGGVSQYDPGSESFINYQEKLNDTASLSSNQTNLIYEDRRGNIWVGTLSGLNLFNKKTKKFVRYIANPIDSSSLSSSWILSVYEDSRGNFWVGTKNGLNLMDRQTGKCTQYLHDPFNKKSIANNYVNKILEDSYGNIWLGTNTGLDLFNRDTKIFTHFSSSYANSKGKENGGLISAIIQDENFLWVGTKALSLFDIKNKTYVDYIDQSNKEKDIKDFEIYSLLRDDQHILWVGTSSSGIYQYDKNLPHFSSFKSGHKNNSYNVIWSFAEDQKGNIWVGMDAGLSYFNRFDNSFTNYTHESKNKNSISGRALTLLKSRENNDLWIGTDNGLDLYHPETGIFQHFGEEKGTSHQAGKFILKLFEDSKGNIWMGTAYEGVIILDKKKQQFIKFQHDPKNPNSLSNDRGIYAFCEDKEGNIWIGNSNGIDIFNPGNNHFIHFNNKKSNLSDDILTVVCLLADSKDNIWIGTMDGGLIRYNKKSNEFVAYTKQQGLANNTINSIIEDEKGFLWLSTNEGIVRFDPVNQKFRNYSAYNGLQDEEFDVGAGLFTKSRDIFFGGINGFNVFNPDSLPENRNIPPVILTGFELFNKPVIIGAKNSVSQKSLLETKEIILSYDQSVFTFEFAALDYTFPEKNQYAYKLEGFDKDWNNVGTKRTATYTNLDPGTYIFKVRGSNNDGIWSKDGVSIKIIITPPFWLTWWFKILAVFIIVGSAIGFYRYRVKSINKQKIYLQQQVQEQTRQLLKSTEKEHKARREAEQANIDLERKNKELEQFAYVASHDLQEPLRTTSSFVGLLQKQYHGKLDEKADKYLTYIHEASDRMKVLVKNLLDLSRIGYKKELEEVDCDKMLHNVLADLAVAISEAGADIKHDRLPVITGYAIELKQLFQNLLANAIKFRKKEIPPQINISAQRNTGYWQFAFKDNGIGIEEKHSEKIFAIFQRLHTQTEYEGSGIGLAHCKKIVELHNGRIWVESIVGEGSTFYFTLPDGAAGIDQLIHRTQKLNGVSSDRPVVNNNL
jgi:ligand-binding sensor domain-containing protein/signal transduction histidine kinase